MSTKASDRASGRGNVLSPDAAQLAGLGLVARPRVEATRGRKGEAIPEKQLMATLDTEYVFPITCETAAKGTSMVNRVRKWAESQGLMAKNSAADTDESGAVTRDFWLVSADGK